MNKEVLWENLQQAFGNQKTFWNSTELAEPPNVTDRLLHYVISYFESPAVARSAIRIFRGIQETSRSWFCGWNELRVSSLREINDALIDAGASGDSWELAITIKDFLQNLWVTLDTMDLTSAPAENPESITAYLKQLRGIKDSWYILNEKGKKESTETPVRFSNDTFYKHFKKYRQMSDPILPDCAVDYLEYLWNRTQTPPFDSHTNRVLARMGVFDRKASITTKLLLVEDLYKIKGPVSHHKRLLQLGKVVCFAANPRCNICPVAINCPKNGLTAGV